MLYVCWVLRIETLFDGRAVESTTGEIQERSSHETRVRGIVHDTTDDRREDVTKR